MIKIKYFLNPLYMYLDQIQIEPKHAFKENLLYCAREKRDIFRKSMHRSIWFNKWIPTFIYFNSLKKKTMCK